MTSRLSALAAVFAVLTTASLALATDLRHDGSATQATAAQTQIVQLERVVVTAPHLPAESR